MELDLHEISIKVANETISGSPFQSKAYDPSKVIVKPVSSGSVGEKLFFTIDPTKAGAGQFHIKVIVDNKTVPNFATIGKDQNISVNFTPEKFMDHFIHVAFNGHPITGSPFLCKIFDSSDITAHGDGLRLAAVQKTASFFVVSSSADDNSELTVEITSPKNKKLNAIPSNSDSSGWKIDYVPQEVGLHRVDINLNGKPIPDSPFHPEIYDSRQVRVSSIAPGTVGKPVAFVVDCQTAGIGTLTVDIRSADQTQAVTEVSKLDIAVYQVVFVPKDNNPYTIAIHFNKDEVEGSPFICPIVDHSLIRVDWDRVQLTQIKKEVKFNIDIPMSSSKSDIEVEILDPSSNLVKHVAENRSNMIIAKFIPRTVGNYTITVTCSGHLVSGCPFICSAYDVSKVEIIDVDSNGKVDDELGFTVDTSKAGSGDLDVEVYCDKQLVRTVRKKLSNTQHRYTYIVQRPQEHSINVLFNLEEVQGRLTYLNYQKFILMFIIFFNFRLSKKSSNGSTWTST